VDDAIGHILEELDNDGLADKTVVIISADHGEEFQEHGFSGHGQSLFQPALAIPLVIKTPGIWPAGTKVGAAAGQVDLYATFCDLCGVTSDKPNQSRSLARFLAPPYDRTRVFSCGPKSGDESAIAVTDGVEKIIYSSDNGDYQLYDLARDPGETKTRLINARSGELITAIAEWRARNAEFRDFYQPDVWGDKMIESRLRAIGYIK
jgi:arylsulfatase A-like enzyme